MITITPQAAEQIAKSAQQAGAGNACLRLAARLGDKGSIEYGMGFDDKAEGDMQVVARDIKVLISPGSVELLTGATLDYVEINPGEPRFIFINPNDPSHKAPKEVRWGGSSC
jgi:iron-sulfur cluster assembly protein